MRFFRWSSLLVLVLCLSPVAAIADHHVNGTWVLNVDLGGGQGGAPTFVLEEKEAGKLSGTYSGALGQADITGTVDGAQVEFSFSSEAGNVTYKGTVSGDMMEGTCNYGDVGSGTFKGKKKAEEG